MNQADLVKVVDATPSSAANVIIRAAQFASIAHNGDTRKWCGDKYIVHPLRVANRALLRLDASEKMVAMALLHDVVEHGADVQTVLKEFGEDITVGVVALSKKRKIEGQSRKERNAIYLEQLRKADKDVKVVKLLDRIDNLMDISGQISALNSNADFALMYAAESLELGRAIGDVDPFLTEEIKLTAALVAARARLSLWRDRRVSRLFNDITADDCI